MLIVALRLLGWAGLLIGALEWSIILDLCDRD